MARNPYIGYTTRYSERYKNTSAAKSTNKHGSTYCTKCKRDDRLELDGEYVQMGFRYNRYMEFVHCKECGYRFCIVMIRTEDFYND